MACVESPSLQLMSEQVGLSMLNWSFPEAMWFFAILVIVQIICG